MQPGANSISPPQPELNQAACEMFPASLLLSRGHWYASVTSPCRQQPFVEVLSDDDDSKEVPTIDKSQPLKLPTS